MHPLNYHDDDDDNNDDDGFIGLFYPTAAFFLVFSRWSF
jgi:hypothetical protein